MAAMEPTSCFYWSVGRRAVKHVTSNKPKRCGTSTIRRSEMPIREHDASEYIRTPEEIAEYLNVTLEEMGDDPRLLMLALRNIVKARGGISAIARQANLDRVALSRALSGQRNPRLDTLAKVTAACGVKLRFSA